MSEDHTQTLRGMMHRAGLTSFKALCQQAGVSRRQLNRLRQGQIQQLSLETLLNLSQALQMELAAFIAAFASPAGATLVQARTTEAAELQALRQEYQRLHTQLQQQRSILWQAFQQETLQTLESFLLQWPTAAHAAQNNPEAPAVKVLPLLRPIEQLLQGWGIEPIGRVGAEVAYDPQRHQLMAGSAQAGDRVVIRFLGYRQGDRLLYRAKVAPKLP